MEWELDLNDNYIIHALVIEGEKILRGGTLLIHHNEILFVCKHTTVL